MLSLKESRFENQARKAMLAQHGSGFPKKISLDGKTATIDPSGIGSEDALFNNLELPPSVFPFPCQNAPAF